MWEPDAPKPPWWKRLRCWWAGHSLHTGAPLSRVAGRMRRGYEYMGCYACLMIWRRPSTRRPLARAVPALAELTKSTPTGKLP